MSADFIKESSESFNKWFNEEVATRDDATLEILPELMSIMYLRLRLWLEEYPARELIEKMMHHVEHLIADDAIRIRVQGEEVPYRTAEDFDTAEDRQFFIQASWGLSDEDFDALLDEDG